MLEFFLPYFREDEQQHSEFHMESSTESLFRTPTLSTRGRKRRSYEEGVAVSVESPNTVGLLFYIVKLFFNKHLYEQIFFNTFRVDEDVREGVHGLVVLVVARAARTLRKMRMKAVCLVWSKVAKICT